jgi:signal transduction histidine kinase
MHPTMTDSTQATATVETWALEEKYKLLFSNMNEGFILGHFRNNRIEPDAFIVDETNDAFTRQVGIPKIKILNKTARQLIEEFGTEGAFWLSIFAKVKDIAKPMRIEYHVKRLDKWFSISFSKPMDNYLAAIFEDITERKKAEADLKASETKYRLLFSNMNEGFILGYFIHGKDVDPSDFKIIEINNTLLEQTGIPKEEFVNKTALQIISEFKAERPFWFPIFAQIKNTDKPIRIEYHFARFDRWYNISIYSPMPDYLAAIFEDITDRKKSEEQLHQKNKALARRSEELASANKELESFSYSISHDLRAPLRAIGGFSQALLEDYKDTLDEQGQDYLNRLHQGAQHMDELVDAILRLSRQTRRELHCEPVNITAISTDIINKLKEEQPDRKINIIISNIQTVGDKELLTTALTNLLRNSWKFTKKTSTPCIEVGTTTQDDTTVYYVKDNGAGFDMKYEDKLFVPFQRLHDPKEYPGIGIGLSTVQHIVHKHGGKIWAEGTPGKGATFYFTLSQCKTE